MNPAEPAAPAEPAEKVWIEGRIVDAAEARVPVFDRGFLYGDSVYEVTRTYGGVPYALGEHLDRLEGSARRLGMTLPPRDEIDHASRETAHAVGGEAYLRIIVTRGSGPISLDPGVADAPRLVVIGMPLKLPPEHLYTDGVSVAVVGAKRNAPGGLDPQVKSGNYLNSVLAVAEAHAKGAFEAIMCDSVGRIAEGSSFNLFLVRGRRLITPPLSVGILEGITRRHVITLARRHGFAVDEGYLWPVDLLRADEAFITSSVRGIMPIATADGHPIGKGRPGPITLQLRDLYEKEAAAAVGA
jgi:branched-chain amino acid aminotransferase